MHDLCRILLRSAVEKVSRQLTMLPQKLYNVVGSS